MNKKINTLSFLHDESIRHNDARLKAVNRFYLALSEYKDLRDFLQINNELSTDERRAKFICAVAKNKFIGHKKNGDSFKMPIKKITFKEKNFTNEKIEFKFSFGELEKTISVSVCISDNWDEVEIDYDFDCFSLANGVLVDEKVKGKSKITIDQDPEPAPYEDEYRNDDDFRLVIDLLHGYLKSKTK